jgi:predicted dinucleotide-binding enzyme
MRGGAGIDLVETFESCIGMRVHDPLVSLPSRPAGSRAIAADDVETALFTCDIVAITTPWPEYSSALQKYLSAVPKVVILDPFRIIDLSWVVTPASHIIQLGVSDEHP